MSIVQVVTSNMRGQLKLWDLRSNQQQPATTFLLSSDQVAVTCLARHPTQVPFLLSLVMNPKNQMT